MQQKIPASIIRQIFVVLILMVAAVLIIYEMLPYLGGVLAAVTLYVLLVPAQRFFEEKGWKPWVAATLLLVVSVIVILLPVAGLGLLFTSQIKDAVANSDQITEQIRTQIRQIEDYVGFDVVPAIDGEQVKSTLSYVFSNFADSSLTVFIAVGVMFFLLYYMLIERKTWQNATLRYLPLKKKNIKAIGKESIDLVKSNALAIPLVAIMQGIVALIGYYIFGVDNPFFWFGVTVIGSMIPFVGTALGIAPVVILLLAQGETESAIGILIYGAVVVGSTDNLFRLIVQKKLADIHPLITLIGVVVGVPLFGFIGLIFGPLLISLFLLLIKIYKKEYGDQKEAI
ncbi:Predicted PurR-regulated permease PerM [Nonlabens sp. Hel1_33_55]|uniref:AI-2E family transporter n=1 Tax=Nonlabens sp. Hel1_33_55 TaxID=1336802 RepID=UPI000875E258|nr:AI-2E family transporter [Nonlabens sp. Hel1_33_55]SCX87452.1 Predicted PurR-regulated permease PerM [Nonlabens sp. Hel1_33_55]